MSIVNEDAPLKEEYSRLVIEERRLRLRLENGTAMCLNCDRPKTAHDRDERCSCSATSMKFRSSERPRLAAISEALQTIERLREIQSC